jgi:hypothetical protein
MADVKISALPAATTPLGGTEALPIVQSGTTKKVSIADVTAGRAMSASSLTLSSPLGVASGGTGLNSLTAGRIPYGDGTNAFGSSAGFSFSGTVLTVQSAISVSGSNFASTTFTGSSVNTTGVYTGLDSGGGYVVNVRDAGYQAFSTSNTERMRLDASGNLGIGTSSPGGRLDVVSADDVPMYFRNTSGVFRIRPYVTSYASAQLASLNAGLSAYAPLAVGGSITTLETNGIERLRIDSSGNVGIGTSSPGSPLVVQSATANPMVYLNATGTQDNAIQWGRSGTLHAAIYADNSGGLISRTVLAQPLYFFTNGTERARIDSSGNLLVGTTTSGARVTVQNTPTSQWGMDFSQSSVTVSNGGNAVLPVGSGVIFVTDQTATGSTGLFILGGAGVVFVSQSSALGGFVATTTTPAGGKYTLGWDGTNYRIYNNYGSSITFLFGMLRSRDSN